MNRRVVQKSILILLLFVTCGNLSFAGQFPSVSLSQLSAPANRPIGEVWARTDLFFGTNKPDGTAVTNQEFTMFLDREITPRFPDGLTVITGYGQFRNSEGVIVQERSVVLILLYPLPTKDSSKKIEEIRTLYKRMFQQESVLRVDSNALVSF